MNGLPRTRSLKRTPKSARRRVSDLPSTEPIENASRLRSLCFAWVETGARCANRFETRRLFRASFLAPKNAQKHSALCLPNGIGRRLSLHAESLGKNDVLNCSGWQKIPESLIWRALQPETLCYRVPGLIRPQCLSRVQHGCGLLCGVSGHLSSSRSADCRVPEKGHPCWSRGRQKTSSSRFLLWSPRANPVACGF